MKGYILKYHVFFSHIFFEINNFITTSPIAIKISPDFLQV